MELFALDGIVDNLPEWAAELWDSVADPKRRRETGMDKVLHFVISFLMTSVLVIPCIRRWSLNWRWIWSVMIPGVGKEIWDFYKKVFIHNDWARYPPVFVDSIGDLLADVAGILVAWLIFRPRS